MISADPSEIVELLQTTFLGDTFQIREAEKSLQEMYGDSNFLSSLLEIAKQNSIPYNIRKAAILYTLTFCRTLNPSNQIMDISKYLFGQLADGRLEINLRRHLIHTMAHLMTLDKNSRIKAVLYGEYLMRCKQTCLDLENMEKIIFIGLGAQMILVTSIHNTKELAELIRATLMYFVVIASKLYDQASNLLGQQNKRDELSFTFQVIKLYSLSFKLYIKKICYSDLQTVKLFFEHQLCNLLKQIWQFGIDENLMPTKIIHFGRVNDWELLQQHHSIKADYMQSLGMIIRTIFQYFKDPSVLATHEIVSKPEAIEEIINALSNVHLSYPYSKIKSVSLIKLIQQSLNCLIICARFNCYYETFFKHKKQLIEECLFNVLQYSPPDFAKFMDDPNEFIHEIMQIMEMDSTSFINNRKKEMDITEESEEVEDYTTLRTVAATLLNIYCKNIDGTLTEIIAFIEKCLMKEKSPKFSNPLLLLILGILRDLICQRTGDDENILKFLTFKLRDSAPPKQLLNVQEAKAEEKQQNLEYLLTMIVIQKYLNRIKQPNPQILPILYSITTSLLVNHELEEGIKITTYQLVTVIVNRDRSYKYSINYVQLVNQLLMTVTSNSDKVLDLLYNLFKFKDEEICENAAIPVAVLDNLKSIIEREMNRKDLGDAEIVNKCWNIITDISQNERFVATIFSHIQMTISSLIQLQEANLSIQYDDHIFVAVNSLIEQRKEVTDSQIKLLDLILKLFYKRNHQFKNAFETICLMFEHGSKKLSSDSNAMKVLLQLAIQSENRSDLQGCNGLLVLQSLIISCSSSFSKEVWQGISIHLMKRLDRQELSMALLKSNIIATISLLLTAGVSNFNGDEYETMLRQVLKNRKAVRDKHSSKMMTLALCDIFRHNSTVIVLESLVDVIKMIETSEGSSGKKQQQEYQESIKLIKNPLTSQDECNYFKSMVNSFKISNAQTFEAILKELPGEKVQFLKQFFSMAKINNETRRIFKIKK